MKQLLAFSAKIAVLLLLIAICQADEGDVRKANGAQMGLFPFPRVGRAGRSKCYDASTRKRLGLIAFPRVGRSGPKIHYSIHGSPPYAIRRIPNPNKLAEMKKADNGEWFGPRLGRVQKRSFDYAEDPWSFVALRDPTTEIRETELIPSMVQDSEEDADDSVLEEFLSSRTLDSKNRNTIAPQ